jgi:hypothetical protein
LKLFRQNHNDRLSPTFISLLAMDFLADFPIKLHKLAIHVLHRLILAAIYEFLDFADKGAVFG